MTTSALILPPPTIETALAKVSANQADVQALTAAFAPHYQALQALVEQAREVKADQPKKAKLIRLEIKAVRVASEKTRKTAKEDSLRRGKAIDGIHNVLEFQCVPMEEALEQIEKAEEIAEAHRKAALVLVRGQQLSPFMDVQHMALGEMTEQVFADLLNGARTAHQNKLDNEAREKAQAEADERRRLKAEQELQEAREAENARLAAEAKKEREARAAADALLAKERAETLAREAQARLEAERLARERQAEIDAERKVIEMQQAQERQKAAAALLAEKHKAEIAQAEIDRLAKEKVAKEQAERDAAAKAAAAPDRAKVLILAAQLAGLPMPTMTTPAGIALVKQAKLQAEKFSRWLEVEAGRL